MKMGRLFPDTNNVDLLVEKEEKEVKGKYRNSLLLPIANFRTMRR